MPVALQTTTDRTITPPLEAVRTSRYPRPRMSEAEPSSLAEEVSQALTSDVDPARLDGFEFAQRILPAYRLVRTLFSQSELDTCLKLMLLHELTRVGERCSLERIRTLVRFLHADRVDGLVRSLREGWLDLRESDRTYAVAPAGVHLLSVLHAADVGSLSPANALSRAAQNAAFGVTLDGAREGAASFLLDQLAVLLDGEVDQARTVLQQGRPHRLIDWSRRDHRRQLDTIRSVLRALAEQLDEGSGAFARVVRLHEAMQEIVRLHTGIQERLRAWNLDRLYTAEAGYSVPELLEAVLGADDAKLESAARDRLVMEPALPPTLAFAEIAERTHGARRKLPTQPDDWRYAPPPESAATSLQAAELDPAAALRAHLTQALAGFLASDEPVEIETWRLGDTFTGTSWELALFARLHAGATTLRLDDGRVVRIEQVAPIPEGVPADQLLSWMSEQGALRPLPEGWFARVRLRILEDQADG